MRNRNVAQLLGGTAAVYLALAACSSATNQGGPESQRVPARSTPDEPLSPGAEEKSLESSRGGSDAIDAARGLSDVGVNSVPNAHTGPTSAVTAACTNPYDVSLGDGLTTAYFAEATYPGKTEVELALVRAIISARDLPGYDHAVRNVTVRSGAVAVACPQGSMVTFVLP